MKSPSASRPAAELRKGLTRSAEVATYLLIKTAIDAGSPQVEIPVNVCLKTTDYRDPITRIREDGGTSADVVDLIAGSKAHQNHPDSLTTVDPLAPTYSDTACFAALRPSHSMVGPWTRHMRQHGPSNPEHVSRTVH